MPAYPLTLLPLSQPAALAALVDGTAHMAFIRLPVDDAELSSIPLYTEQPVVVASKGHALEAADSVTLAELDEFGLLDGHDWAAAVELAAANAGVAVMPQSVARAHSRKDVTARPVSDAPDTRVALAWPTGRTTAGVEEFIGVVRGRTANSSRGAQPAPLPPTPKKPAAKAATAKTAKRRTAPSPKRRGR